MMNTYLGMNLNMKCSDGTQLNGTAVSKSERPDTSLWSSWTVSWKFILYFEKKGGGNESSIWLD